MTSVYYNQALYCSECDLIFSNKHSGCPVCCNKNGVSMNAIRNGIAKEVGDLKDRRGKVRSSNINQLSLF
jgi:hypothetical protein